MKYNVVLPVTGIASCVVEADTEHEAVKKALRGDSATKLELESWDAHEHVLEGNVFNGELDSAYAEPASSE